MALQCNEVQIEALDKWWAQQERINKIVSTKRPIKLKPPTAPAPKPPFKKHPRPPHTPSLYSQDKQAAIEEYKRSTKAAFDARMKEQKEKRRQARKPVRSDGRVITPLDSRE